MANYGNVDVFGDPRSPGWEDQNLVAVRAPNGQTWRVHRLAAPSFEGFLTELAASGYNPMSSGGFNYRTIRGSDRLSQHAFGNAVDINAATNPMLNGQLQTDMPTDIGDLAARYGIEWGGAWKNRPDPMHFEWKGQGGAPAAPNLPSMFAGAAQPGPSTMAGATPGGNVFGQIASMFLQDQANRQQAQAEQQQAEQARRAALFGGGVASLYG